MKKGNLKHKFGSQFMERRSRFTRKRGVGYAPTLRLTADCPQWNPNGATREGWRLGTHPGLLPQREEVRIINKHFNSRNSRRYNKWAECFLWRIL